MSNSLQSFARRHLGPNAAETETILEKLGVSSIDQLIDETVPAGIRRKSEIKVPTALTEQEYLDHLAKIAAKNQPEVKSLIGLGYFGTITPSAIARNVFHNPGWYTQYTPYQAEIAQGRLEALLNFQTVISDLTGLPIANASLLDEGTAAAEAMSMFYAQKNKRVKKGAQPANVFLVSDQVLPQTIAVLETRALPIGIELRVIPVGKFAFDATVFGMLLQYPGADGEVVDLSSLVQEAKKSEVFTCVATDLLALCMLQAPGDWGVDCAVGNSQRFGVPLGYGGPHAAFFATTPDFRRLLPGRIIGVSEDSQGNPAMRMALQTREQHIRREKATSNICTAQALLAIMAGMYAVYHGPKGLRDIAERVHARATGFAETLNGMGISLEKSAFFDTLRIRMTNDQRVKLQGELKGKINLYYDLRRGDDFVQVSFDETVTDATVAILTDAFASAFAKTPSTSETDAKSNLPATLARDVSYLAHPVFSAHQTETKLMRYIKRLENKDLSLTHSMIALGSCTMKLNAATELMPVSWPAFADIHPFAPVEQAAGYMQMFEELGAYLADICGFTATSLQPNSGAQGEYAGLTVIRAYHLSRGDDNRDVALIPESAHGTNPASAVMAGMRVVVVKSDAAGNIDLDDLKAKAEKHSANLSALMVTYPSTYGVFEADIVEICEVVHNHGGMVYMDGANMNAQVGLTSPGICGADVCHLNLHKTFAIPHGGGGPGMGPICVNDKLAPFLPSHPLVPTGGEQGTSPVSAAPFGSSSILLISYAYICMLGPKGLTDASRYAILNANYIAKRLEGHYDILFQGEKGWSAHELILDLRPFKSVASAEDVAKRLIDYSFHAPTLSWPVAGTMMVEPTESESLDELDRFCDAMISIREEMDEVARGEADASNNVLQNAPHTLTVVTNDTWEYPYTRAKAAFALPYLRESRKFWPSVARVNQALGDRNLVCTCPDVSSYAEEEME
ncbi:MAG: aminomethyl-transferring glycine dehydrogenase [Saprospiraceae bacterium]